MGIGVQRLNRSTYAFSVIYGVGWYISEGEIDWETVVKAVGIAKQVASTKGLSLDDTVRVFYAVLKRFKAGR